MFRFNWVLGVGMHLKPNIV